MHRPPLKNLLQLYSLGAIFLLVIGFWWLWSGQRVTRFERLTNWSRASTSSTTIAEINCLWRSQLNGACVADPTQVAQPVVAVMIENHVAARPQAGLVDAAIVYEVPVEANYTRFLALYPLGADIKKVGPVRSARPYFLDWLAEWGKKPLYMHVGGSPAALEKISDRNILNINEMYRGWYFWRSSDRAAPHNTYTSASLWQKAWDDYKGGTAVASSSWHFSTGTVRCEFNCTSKIAVSFLPPAFAPTWQYVSSTNQYARYQMGEPHRDDDGRAIMADTVIVQFVPTRVLDEVGRLGLDTIGEGEAVVLHNRLFIHSRWRKTGLRAPTEWLHDGRGGDDTPIDLKPGKIWIEVVPRNRPVTFE